MRLTEVKTQRAFEVISIQITERIRRGELRSGDRLPNERELAAVERATQARDNAAKVALNIRFHELLANITEAAGRRHHARFGAVAQRGEEAHVPPC